jgi:hypothetical protein
VNRLARHPVAKENRAMQKRGLGTSGLEENLGAVTIRLSADDLREIDEAASAIDVHGARYPEHLQKLVGR